MGLRDASASKNLTIFMSQECNLQHSVNILGKKEKRLAILLSQECNTVYEEECSEVSEQQCTTVQEQQCEVRIICTFHLSRQRQDNDNDK